MWQNQQTGMCSQRRLRSAWASAQSDQSLHCPHEESLGPQLPIKCTAKTDQTGRMPRLIWVFAGRTCHFVGFVTMRLICVPSKSYLIRTIYMVSIFTTDPTYLSYPSISHYSGFEPHFDLMWKYKNRSRLFGVDRKLCPSGSLFGIYPHQTVMVDSFPSHPVSFIAFCHFKCETVTNILTETQSLFCSCGYNIINLVQRLQLHVHVYIIGRVAIS